MNATKADVLRAVRGPILLLLLGALIVVDHAGAMRFSQSWPLLVIVYGFLKLLERTMRPGVLQYPAAPPPYGAPGAYNAPGANPPAAPPPPPGGIRT